MILVYSSVLWVIRTSWLVAKATEWSEGVVFCHDQCSLWHIQAESENNPVALLDLVITEVHCLIQVMGQSSLSKAGWKEMGGKHYTCPFLTQVCQHKNAICILFLNSCILHKMGLISSCLNISSLVLVSEVGAPVYVLILRSGDFMSWLFWSL